jgi:transposase
MPKRRNQTHSAAFREEVVRQALTRDPGISLRRFAADVGVNYSALRLWLKEAKSADEPSDSKDGEVQRLRKEVRELRVEREILKKAMAFFAKHMR